MTHTVLIVDDSPTAVPQLKALFESEGYQVQTALRGEEALDRLHSAKIDLVVTEALLSGMDGFELVRRIRRDNTLPTMPIIMVTVRSGAEDYAASYDAGVDEHFLKPIEPLKIAAASRGLIARYESSQYSAPGTGGFARRSKRGEITTVFSIKGGVGTSTLAVNLAVAVKKLTPSSRVGLIDLGLEQGADALMLDIVPTSSLADWAREDPNETSPQLLNEYFVTHKSGISLMSAPPSPEQAEIVRPDAVRRTLQMAPEVFDYIVLDTAATFSESGLIALEMAHSIVLPLTPDMMALKATVNTMRILKAVNIPEDKIQVVLNEIVPRAGLSKQQVESSLNLNVFEIPHSPAFVEAANHGVPAVMQETPTPATQALMSLASQLCVPDMPEAVEEVPSGLLTKLRPDFLRRGA